MKAIKRMLAVVLAVVMMMGLGVTSMAKETVYDSSVSVVYEVQKYPDSSKYQQSKLPTAAEWKKTYVFNKAENKTAKDAIEETAKQLSPEAGAVTGINKDGDTYIDSIFTLPTINNYGTDENGKNTWEGYYWKIIVTGLDEEGNEVIFDSPVYANKIPLGVEHEFTNEYDTTTFPITCTVTKITMQYCYDSMSW